MKSEVSVEKYWFVWRVVLKTEGLELRSRLYPSKSLAENRKAHICYGLDLPPRTRDTAPVAPPIRLIREGDWWR